MRTYVVTGSASGIGAAFRERVERAGARVIGVDLHDADVLADLSTAAGRGEMVERVERAADGRVDALVACAGVGGGEHPPDAVIPVNYFGAVATLEGLRPLLAGSKAPRAAVVSSIDLLSGPDDGVTTLCLEGDEDGAVLAAGGSGPLAYAGSKRAIARWLRHAAVSPEWAGAGIPLNAVAPGVIETPMTTYLVGTAAVRANTLKRVPQPLGGIGRPEQVAALLDWLTGEENEIVTGQVVFIDGGHEALMRPGELPRGADAAAWA